MEFIKKNIIQNERVVMAIILAVFSSLYFGVYISAVFPYTDGWFSEYDALINAGNHPYKDFYYYMPPLHLVIDHLFLLLSNGLFLGVRFCRLIERVVMLEAMYLLLSKFYRPKIVAFSCFIGGIVGASQVFDLMGDYTQTGHLVLVFIAYTSVNFAKADTRKKQNQWLFLSGILVGILFSIKQSIFLATCIVYFIILTIFCIINKSNKCILYYVYAFLGILIPIGCCLGWMIYHNCLIEFLSQVYFTGAKGSLLSILFGSIKVVLKNNFSCLGLAFIIFGMFVFLRKRKDKLLNFEEKVYFIIICSTFFCIIADNFYYTLRDILYAYIESGYWIIFTIIILLPMIAFIFKEKIIAYCSIKIYEIIENISILSALIITGIYFSKNINDISDYIYNTTDAQAKFCAVMPILCCFLAIILTAYLLIVYMKDKKNTYYLSLIMILASSLAACYTDLMSAREYIVAAACWLTVPILLSFAFSMNVKFNKAKNYALVIGAILICSSFLAQKVMSPFTWWGWQDGPISEKKYSVNIRELTGYKFSKDEKLLFEETVKIINDNTNESSTILGFPHITVFNALTNHTHIDWFVPVLFYDVCSDEYAQNAADDLKRNPPDIVIWCDLPGGMEYHEEVFREGKPLGQRDIQNWFVNSKDERYSLIGQINNIFIYKLNNNGIPKGYTFIQDNLRENITAGEGNY